MKKTDRLKYLGEWVCKVAPSLSTTLLNMDSDYKKGQKLEKELAESGKKNLSKETIKEINMAKFNFEVLNDEQFNKLKENIVTLNKALIAEIDRRGKK